MREHPLKESIIWPKFVEPTLPPLKICVYAMHSCAKCQIKTDILRQIDCGYSENILRFVVVVVVVIHYSISNHMHC